MSSLIFLLLPLAGLFEGTARASEAPEPLASHQALLRERQRTLTGLWAFASLNYLYCDVISLMDAEMLRQYEKGTVNGVKLTDGFLAGATVMMQVPLSMVMLSSALSPKASRVANISAGLLMTAVQSASLFVGRPNAPHYVVSSAVEIGTTAFITVYAWRGLAPPRAVPVVQLDRGRPTVGVAIRW